MQEIWKVIDGFPDYEVSNLGKVISLRSGIILEHGISSTGYATVNLFIEETQFNKQVHRLVAEAFVPNPNPNNKKIVNHKNGIKLDNTNTNLEWVTHAENMKHAGELGLMKSGEEHYATILSSEDVEYIRRVYTPRHKEFGGAALGRKFGVGRSQISRIINNKSRKGG